MCSYQDRRSIIVVCNNYFDCFLFVCFRRNTQPGELDGCSREVEATLTQCLAKVL